MGPAFHQCKRCLLMSAASAAGRLVQSWAAGIAVAKLSAIAAGQFPSRIGAILRDVVTGRRNSLAASFTN
jgi:hypothetical protein